MCSRSFVLDTFSLGEETMIPSYDLLQRATNRDDPYLTSLFKLIAVQLPHTALTLLEGLKLLREEIAKIDEKAFMKQRKVRVPRLPRSRTMLGLWVKRRNREEAVEVLWL
jgi:hypothetical protein